MYKAIKSFKLGFMFDPFEEFMSKSQKQLELEEKLIAFTWGFNTWTRNKFKGKSFKKSKSVKSIRNRKEMKET